MVKIDENIKIAELAEKYPEVVDFLIYEYGFHCIGCFVSEFETLIEGAQVHGITGSDYDEMILRVENIINSVSEN